MSTSTRRVFNFESPHKIKIVRNDVNSPELFIFGNNDQTTPSKGKLPYEEGYEPRTIPTNSPLFYTKAYKPTKTQILRDIKSTSATARLRGLQAVKDGLHQLPETDSEEEENRLKALAPKPVENVNEVLKGVVAYVEVFGGGLDMSQGIKDMLKTLGAIVRDTFLKDVTHVVFKEGYVSTYKKAISRNIPLVSVSWIEMSRKQMYRVNETLYPSMDLEEYKMLALLNKRGKPKHRLETGTKRTFKKNTPGPLNLDDSLSSDCSLPDAKASPINSPQKHSESPKASSFTVESNNCSPNNKCEKNDNLAVNLMKRFIAIRVMEKNSKIDTTNCNVSTSKISDMLAKITVTNESEQNLKTENTLTSLENNEKPKYSKVVSSSDSFCSEEIIFGTQSPIKKKRKTFFVPPLIMNNSNSSSSKSTSSLSTSKSNSLNNSSSRSGTGSENGSLKLQLSISESSKSSINLRNNSNVKSVSDTDSNLEVNLHISESKHLSVSDSSKESSNKLEKLNCSMALVAPVIASPRRQSMRIAARESLCLITPKKTTSNLNAACKKTSESNINVEENINNEENMNNVEVVLTPRMERMLEVQSIIKSITKNYDSPSEKENETTNQEPDLNTPKLIKKRKLYTNTRFSDISIVNSSISNADDNTNDFYIKLIKNAENKPSQNKDRRKTIGTTKSKLKANRRITSYFFAETDSNISQTISESMLNNMSTIVPPRRSSLDFQKKLSQNVQKTVSQKPIANIVCTSLHTDQSDIVKRVVKKLGGFVLSKCVNANTSHVVALEPRRTLNLLKGIVRGCWIVCLDWVLKSDKAGIWLDENSFELTNFSISVQKSRIEKQSFGHLFQLDIFATCGSILISKRCSPPWQDLEELVTLCSGKTVSSYKNADIIVGQFHSNSICVTPLWILDSITDYKLKSTHDYLIKC